MLRFLSFHLGLIACFLLATAAIERPAFAESWTVLVYWAVDNDLYPDSVPYLSQFQEVGSSSNLRIVAEVDYPGSLRKTERLEIFNPSQVKSDPSLDLPYSRVIERFKKETDSADPATLTDFLLWGVRRFPADRYLVVLASHGMNWRGIIEDHDSGTVMPLEGVRRALYAMNQQRGQTLELLVADACRMSFADTLLGLAGQTQWMVGSQFDVNGFEHARPLLELARRPGLSPAQLGLEYVRSYPRRDALEPNFSASLLHLQDPGRDPMRVSWSQDMRWILDRLLELSPGQLLLVRDQLQITQNDFADQAIDFGNLMGALLSLLDPATPGLKAISDRYLTYSQHLDPQDGSVLLTQFHPQSVIQAASFTAGSQSATGLSLNCPKDLNAYRSSVFALLFPEWLEVCAKVSATFYLSTASNARRL